MKIRYISIANYRGIKELKWIVPDSNLVCIIGKGDSSKTTILEAIKLACYPHWNLTLNDTDFHNATTSKSILIELTLGDLPDDFCQLTKYGHSLRGWDLANGILHDEPNDNCEEVITIRLLIDENLEPKWSVICDRHPDGVEFKLSDRRKLNVAMIGAYSERQLSWSAGSPLSFLTDDVSLNGSLVTASRSAKMSIDQNRDSLLNFDKAASISHTVAQEFGIKTSGQYQAHLDLSSINLKSGGLSLHDGDIPVRQLGLGSRRMLLCGLQQKCLESQHVTLIDELEHGLEPHRITRLVKQLENDSNNQYFMTTHSPAVLRELSTSELCLVHNTHGVMNVINTSDPRLEAFSVQGRIRGLAEAFLAKKVIICEGATEVGFLRGYDDYKFAKKTESLAYFGIALVDANGGSKVKHIAQSFKALHFQVAVFADSDAQKQFSKEDEFDLEVEGIEVITWKDELSLEERVFMDLPWEMVKKSLVFASDDLGFSVKENVVSQQKSFLDENIDLWVESVELRSYIGKAAKSSNWFKDISRGEEWCNRISVCFDNEVQAKTDLVLKLNTLWNFVER